MICNACTPCCNMPQLDSRSMIEDDLPQVFAIETLGHSHPWSEAIFSDCLRVGYDCRVFEQDGAICAFAIMSYGPGEAHLLNLCVHPKFQGQGIGTKILRQLLERASSKNADTLFLEVRRSNLRARRLYEKAGFNEVGRRFDYYPADTGREDALVFARTLREIQCLLE